MSFSFPNLIKHKNLYRPEIDGLRAIAVLSVILFHSDISLFSGGYVGVDVFFVISGYLITKILYREIQNNSFSILSFYERRIKRIFPALFLMLCVAAAIAYYILLPREFRDFKSSLIASVAFYSNYYFMQDVGYFANPPVSEPLLHTWSLAVEEQFYVVFPVYLFIVFKLFKKNLTQIITFTLLILSLIYSIKLVDVAPTDAFYSPFARAWELLVGSVLALYFDKFRNSPNKILVNILSVIGIIMVVYSILLYSASTQFPGATAIIPVLGTVLLLFTGSHHGNIVGKLLSTAPFRFTGLISYSLYLWHWPVLVFYKIYMFGDFGPYDKLLALALIFLLSYLSWRYIEVPFRKGILFYDKQFVFSLRTVLLVLPLLFLIIFSFTMKQEKLPKELRNIFYLKNETEIVPTDCFRLTKREKLGFRGCRIGEPGAKISTFAVWGDSHAQALLAGIDLSAKNHHVTGTYVGRGGCLSLLGVERTGQSFEMCDDVADSFLLYLQEHPEIETVILASRWAVYAMGTRYSFEEGGEIFIKDKLTRNVSLEENQHVFTRGFQRTLDKISALGKNIVIVTQVPENKRNIRKGMVRMKLLNKEIDFRTRTEDYYTRQQIVNKLIESNTAKYHLDVINPESEICDETYCHVIYGDNKLIYHDTNHITRSFSYKLSALFDNQFEKLKR